MKEVKMVSVIATAKGYDGLVVREPGEEFMVPSTMFDKRPRMGPDKKPDGTFYDPPSWFKKKSHEREKAVRLREQARSAAIIAEADNSNKQNAAKAKDLDERATAAEAAADKIDAEEEAGGDLA